MHNKGVLHHPVALHRHLCSRDYDFIKNMINGASQVDVAPIMVPADGNFTTATHALALVGGMHTTATHALALVGGMKYYSGPS